MATEAPILSLSTLAPKRQTIRVDDDLFELTNIDDFGLQARAELAKDLDLLNELEKLEEASTVQQRRYDALILRMARSFVPDMPVRKMKALGTTQQGAIVKTFLVTSYTLSGTPQLETLMARMALSIGGRSSPGSSTSTEGAPSNGSGSPLPSSTPTSE